jgi:hypothetical protein
MVSNADRDKALQLLCCGFKWACTCGPDLDFQMETRYGGYYGKFAKRKTAGIGHAHEGIWEMKVSRALADACLRRGAIPPLSSDFLR